VPTVRWPALLSDPAGILSFHEDAMIGKTLAHYEILDELGRGGMGVVYRARDTKLGREVAIKVLPEAFAADKDRVARFEREARLLASLNHPNIATIHGIENVDGTVALVLELVEGPTLAERIAQGPIPLEEAMAIARQIADALDAAHEAGVMHRDLKPANVKIKEDGTVKVLDFGLAKALDSDEAAIDDSAMSQSPTLTRQGTALGVILGTAAYMSPEQAKGKRVDKRTDIFAFGALVYEMLTGKKAFPGKDIPEVLAAVINTEPDWEALPSTVSLRLRALLERCVDKDHKKRRRDIGDVRNELEDSLTAKRQRPSPRTWSTKVFIGVSIGSAVIAGLLVGLSKTPENASTGFVRHVSVAVPPEHQLRIGITCGSAVALSPDGSTLVYVGMGEGKNVLFVRPLDQPVARRIDGTAGACQPFFSPDGASIAFFADEQLKSVLVNGGPVLIIAEPTPSPGGGAWAADGTIWFSSGEGPLKRVSATGGDVRRGTTLDSSATERRHSYPFVMPDGTSILFNAHGPAGHFVARAEVSAADSHQRITEDKENIRGLYFVETGHLVFHSGTSLFAVPFEPSSAAAAVEPTKVLDGIPYTGRLHAHFGMARDGTLAYLPSSAGAAEAPVWVDRNGDAVPIAGAPPQHYMDPRLSPDGKRLAMTVIDSDELDVWVLNLRRDTLARVTFDPAGDLRALWTPDGQSLVFASNRAGAYDLYEVSADASAEPRRLTTGEVRQPTAISSDGRRVIFVQRNDNGNTDIGVVQLDGTSAPELLLATAQKEETGVLSPNDRWLAYVSDESGRSEVYLRSFPDMRSKVQVSVGGGSEPMWSPKGDELFYRSEQKMMAVPFDTAGKAEPGRPALLFEAPYLLSVPSAPWADYDVSRDGDKFVMIRQEDPEGPTEIRLILNWSKELQRLAPSAN